MSQVMTAAKSPLWKQGRNANLEFLSSFKHLQQEDPETYNLIEQKEGYICQDHEYEYKVGKSRFGLWCSRRRMGLDGIRQIENDKSPARPSAFIENIVDSTTIVIALGRLTDAIKLQTLAMLVSSDNEREDIRKRVLAG